MSGLCWYVIQTHPRKEKLVEGRIRDLAREAFLPTVAERRPGQRHATIGPLFPGYLFARLSHGVGDLARVRWTQGVRRVLGDREGPRPIDDLLIEGIRAHADPTGRVRFGRGLRKGERVRVVDGPLAGLLGILERAAATPTERVCVLLEVFSRSTRVELPAHAIRRAGSAR